MTRGEVSHIFSDDIIEYALEKSSQPLNGHVKNWNYWSRTYIAERDDSTMNLK